MRALGELKTTMEELLVTLGNIVKACFKLFFKTPFCSFECDKFNFEQICSQFPLIDRLFR
jgi:hypothetical protein